MEVRGAEAASCMGVVEACGCRKEVFFQSWLGYTRELEREKEKGRFQRARERGETEEEKRKKKKGATEKNRGEA